MSLSPADVVTPRVSKSTDDSNACPVAAEAFLGQWTDSMGHNVLVVNAIQDSKVLKVFLSKPDSTKPKELIIKMDVSLKRWRCGNGVLDVDQLANDKDSSMTKPTTISWVNWNGKGSIWTREKSWSDVVQKKGAAKGTGKMSPSTEMTSVTQVAESRRMQPRIVAANGVEARVFKGQWRDSLGNDINVTSDGCLSQGLLKATITKADDSNPKELLIGIDSRIGRWRCGNGALNDDIEYHNDQAIILSWTTWNGRVSTWTREVDYSSTDEGTEENLKETWWNMTEEWEDEKCALKDKIGTKHRKNVCKDEDAKQPKATRSTRTNDSAIRKNESPWLSANDKKQKAENDSCKNRPLWREVDGWKRDEGKGGRRQQRAQY